MLKIEHIKKTIKGKKILDDLSLQVAPGELAILLGPSGVGKSTLLRILNNLERYDAGTITLNDAPLDMTHIKATHPIGMVFQNFNIFEHLTVQENITLALEHVLKKDKKNALQIAHDLLEHYDLLPLARRYPSQLSGGQKQRLAIARTLAIKPQVICLDEPTSALDPLLTTAVAQTIQDLMQNGFIVVVTTHDLSLVEQLPGTLYLMHEGRIIEKAPSKAFYANTENFPRLKEFMRG